MGVIKMGKKHLFPFLGINMALLLTSLAAQAAGDPEAGRQKAELCAGCHGIPGYRNAYPSYRVPKLGGQHAEYIIAALKAYQAGDRNHPPMIGSANSLTDEDIADIAAFLSGEAGK